LQLDQEVASSNNFSSERPVAKNPISNSSNQQPSFRSRNQTQNLPAAMLSLREISGSVPPKSVIQNLSNAFWNVYL